MSGDYYPALDRDNVEVVTGGVERVTERGVVANDGSERESVRRAIAEGLRFVVSNNVSRGSFAIDLVAMTFGMPRALFAVLALTVYHAGASGTGLLYATVAAGGTLRC